MSLTPFRGRCHTCGHDHDAEDNRLRDVLEICRQAGPEELREENARLRQELRNIAEAKRFDRSVFATDTDFADWAQSRCRYQVRGDASADAAVRKPPNR